MGVRVPPDLLPFLRSHDMQKLQQYIKEVVQEMKKVNWPSWEELKGSTLVVMLFSVIMGCYIAALDLGLSFVVDKLLGRG